MVNMVKSISSNKILQLLKQAGPQTAQTLAERLGMTSMGARQHLQAMEKQGLLSSYDQSEKRGRPSRYWQLTANADQFFPDRHNELTVTMIDAVKTVFGDTGLNRLIEERERQSKRIYLQAVQHVDGLFEKVKALAKVRSDEGYMATVEQDEQGVWLHENHCPICVAAASCQQFCRSELALFSEIMGAGVRVKRTEHIMAGARRCSYYICSESH